VKQKIVETVVEKLEKVPAGASCFVEPAEGARLIVKIWRRGQLKDTRWLRATALPVGSYTVVDGAVVHRHDPTAVIAELMQHQHRVRMESPAFVAIATKIAKQLGGSLERWENMENRFLGYQVEPKSRAGIDDKKLVKVRKAFAGEALVFRAGSGETSPIGIAFAARDLDLVSSICDRWYEDVETLIRMLDTECGARVEQLAHDLIVLHVQRAPKHTAPFARLIKKIGRDSELEGETVDEFVRDLVDHRRLHLWWD
jgi:hypothetical protein